MEYEEVPPKADAMVASMRAIGYDLSMAVADIVDNSISARARNVWIAYDWNDGDPWVRIKDDGAGMTEEAIREAMRLGSRSPLDVRDPDDLGRFGLGLKTASFSQCRIFSVISKTPNGTVSSRTWDLDVIERTREWKLSLRPPEGSEGLLDVLDDVDSGTAVLWQKLDRLLDDIQDQEKARSLFYGKFTDVSRYLEMVFHRYMTGPSPIKIFMGRSQLMPWDPFLTSNQFTRVLTLSETCDNGSVRLVPYVLPHVSNRTVLENQRGGGPKGWNAQQGFYVYRNRRMIVSGGYLDFNLKPEEHYKLARISIDLDNEMDHDWRIDVRKALAIPPDRLRADLQKVASATREEAIKVYRARTGKQRKGRSHNTTDIWVKRRKGEKIVYEINRENEVIKRIIQEIDPPEPWTNKLFSAIERTIPHREIVIDTCGNEDCHVDLPENLNPPEKSLIDLCLEFYREYRRQGRTHEEAADLVTSFEPFNTHPSFRANLDRIQEEQE